MEFFVFYKFHTKVDLAFVKLLHMTTINKTVNKKVSLYDIKYILLFIRLTINAHYNILTILCFFNNNLLVEILI